MWGTGPDPRSTGDAPSVATAFATHSHGRITFPAGYKGSKVVTVNVNETLVSYGPTAEAPNQKCCDHGRIGDVAFPRL